MWPNLSQVLSCTEEGMRIGERGEVMSNFFDKFYYPFGDFTILFILLAQQDVMNSLASFLTNCYHC